LTATISLQERFLSYGPSNESTSTWYVPFTLRSEASDLWSILSDVMQEDEAVKTVPAPGGYVLLNADHAGFYRVNYDLLNWIRVSRAMWQGFNLDSPDVLRAALIDDAFALSWSGQLEPWVPLELLEAAFPRDRSLAVWAAVQQLLPRLRALLRYNQDAVDLLDVSDYLVVYFVYYAPETDPLRCDAV
jgi:hypothetical protein